MGRSRCVGTPSTPPNRSARTRGQQREPLDADLGCREDVPVGNAAQSSAEERESARVGQPQRSSLTMRETRGAEGTAIKRSWRSAMRPNGALVSLLVDARCYALLRRRTSLTAAHARPIDHVAAGCAIESGLEVLRA